MSIYTLTIIDTTSVQGYIFGSNRLRENLGASQLVEMAINEFLDQAISDPEAALKHNLIDSSLHIEDISDSLDVEVILRGGGNAILLSRQQSIAFNIVGRLSRILLCEAPGLEIAAIHQDFDWDTCSIGGESGVYQKAQQHLACYKQQRKSSTPLLGLAVTLESRSTGLPAVAFDQTPDTHAVSADVLAKVDDCIKDKAKERLQQLFGDITEQYDLSDDLDKLGGTRNESRYIAVVHADGNGIGLQFKNTLKAYPQPKEDNRKCLEALSALSKAVKWAGETALANTVKKLASVFQEFPHMFDDPSRRDWESFMQDLSFKRDPNSQNERPILPFRPIVFGGDDVTFVCDGRLGLPLAAIYLKEWEQATKDLSEGPYYACAGVAVVKTHYPFARAYQLSSNLTANAKRFIKANNLKPQSAIDWHFAHSGIFGDVSDIREREYHIAEDNLIVRPITLNNSENLDPTWRSWPHLRRLIGIFRGDILIDGYIYANRNKVKALREALRSGPEAVRSLRLASAMKPLPKIKDVNDQNLYDTGWDTNRNCGYFDAIEAIDFFLPLEAWEEAE